MIKHEPNKTPTLWWLFPWSYAMELKKSLDAIHELYSFERGAYENSKTVIKQKEEALKAYQNAAHDTIANLNEHLNKKKEEIDELYNSHADLSIQRDNAKACHIDALAKIANLNEALKKERASKSVWYSEKPEKPKAKSKAKKKKKAVRRG